MVLRINIVDLISAKEFFLPPLFIAVWWVKLLYRRRLEGLSKAMENSVSIAGT
jgi:hypothetical protein